MQTLIYLILNDPAERSLAEQSLQGAGLDFRSYPDVQALLDAEPEPEPEAGCVIFGVQDQAHWRGLRRTLQDRGFRLPVLLLAHDEDVVSLYRAARSGEVAVLERPVSSTGLIGALGELLETQRRRREEESELQVIASRIARLTQREAQVTMKVLQGLSNKEISSELGISVRTVEKHRAAVMSKLGASNLVDLCRMRPHCERAFADAAKASGKSG